MIRSKGNWLRALMAAAACVGGCTAVRPLSPGSAPHESRMIIRNVNVIPMEREEVLPDRDVVIAGDRIAAIAPGGSIRPVGTDRVIEAQGKYLIPALWDMHAHALTGIADPAVETLPLYLSYGIVGIRDLGSTLEELTAAKAKLSSRPDLPAVVGAGPLLDGPRQPWTQKMALPLETVEEAATAARRLAGAGVDFLKIYNTLSPEQHAAIAAVAQTEGIDFAGHVPFSMTADQVSAAGQKSIEHVGLPLIEDCTPLSGKATAEMLSAWIKDGYAGKFVTSQSWWAKRDAAACRALYARLASRGTWVTPTLGFELKGGSWTETEDLATLTSEQREACRRDLDSIAKAPEEVREAYFANVLEQVRELHQAGVPLLAGTDAPNTCIPHGRGLHGELQRLHHAGLSPWEALATATVNPARYFGHDDQGVVREGARADLLLLDADPTANIRSTLAIAGLFKGGKWFDAADLERMRGPADQRTTIYENGMVWTGADFAEEDLAVRGGMFVPLATAGAGAERIDLAGSYVVPGYGNAHAHLTNPTEKQSWFFLENGVFYIWNPNTVVMDKEALDFFRRKDTFDVAVAQGGITEPGGHPERLYVDVLSKYVYRDKPREWFLGNAFHYGRTPEEIDAALDLLKEQEADFVKAYLLHSEDYSGRLGRSEFYGYRGLNPVNFPYFVAAARERNLLVAVHVETVHDLKIAALSGAAIAAHLPGHVPPGGDEEFTQRVLTAEDAAAIARTGMMLVPTYALAAGYYREAEEKKRRPGVPEEEMYRAQARNLRLLKEAGATFLMGTDTLGPIFEEAEHLVRIGGFSEAEAARIVFETAARLFPERRIGCFKAGCEADFLVLARDPTRDIAALRTIERRVKGGKELAPPAQ